jgi:single-strand DNA-binding protein
MNVVCIVGRLCADPELKYTPAGVAVTTMRVAVDNPYRKGEDGKKTADFFTVVAWRQTAEFIANYGEKGREVEVSGRLQVREWTTGEGQKRSMVEISANELRLVGPKPANGHGGHPHEESPPDDAYDDQYTGSG